MNTDEGKQRPVEIVLLTVVKGQRVRTSREIYKLIRGAPSGEFPNYDELRMLLGTYLVYLL